MYWTDVFQMEKVTFVEVFEILVTTLCSLSELQIMDVNLEARITALEENTAADPKNGTMISIYARLEFFTITPQHKSGNIAHFVMSHAIKIKNTNKVYNFENNPFYQLISNFTIVYILRYK